MEVKVLESTKDKMRFEVYGADHTLMTMLREELLKNKNVEFSTYSTPHPLLPGFVVTVTGKDPEKEVKKALAGIKDSAKEIKAAFKKAK